ncbi:hypothetical protein SNE35_03020 [Paucibacter sp. R3-3]|uniref:Uncharacterized protein n=1 Tax=Roseateles agri TaxID=3098619 RepID=A0ABU5DB26_9BURK|nr:hypothetical protein [Paucibacter sp. R3-3]MDY0743455.1 hypothetical protein [Paucibacter sp. R3-3]
MHVEPPGHAPQTLKEFGTHYLMIVLGILTAIGIEQGVETIHHNHLAHQATEHIEEELQANLQQARETLAQNRQRLTELQAIQEAVIRDVQQKDDSLATFAERLKAVHVGAATPVLRRDAWDAAIASQALSYLDPALVRRFSEGYSAQRDTMQTILTTFALGNWPGQIQNVSVDAKLGKVDQPAFLKALAAYQLALSAISSNEHELEQAFSAALGSPGKAPH